VGLAYTNSAIDYLTSNIGRHLCTSQITFNFMLFTPGWTQMVYCNVLINIILEHLTKKSNDFSYLWLLKLRKDTIIHNFFGFTYKYIKSGHTSNP